MLENRLNAVYDTLGICETCVYVPYKALPHSVYRCSVFLRLWKKNNVEAKSFTSIILLSAMMEDGKDYCRDGRSYDAPQTID